MKHALLRDPQACSLIKIILRPNRGLLSISETTFNLRQNIWILRGFIDSLQGRIHDFFQEGGSTKEWNDWLVRLTNFKREYEESFISREGG